MLNTYIASQIYNNFGFEPTFDQKKLIESISLYLADGQDNSIFLLNGYAGTGKTTIVGAVVRTLQSMQINVVLLAPTGRAAKVMGQYAGKDAHPYTIHKKIYRQKRMGLQQFSLNINKDNNTIYIVDEASMLSNGDGMYQSEEVTNRTVFGSGQLLDDLTEYVFTGDNNRLVFVGDQAQLPPVGHDISPALDPSAMSCFGSHIYYSVLRDVVRQSSESAILLNATLLRGMIESMSIGDPQFTLVPKQAYAISGRDLVEHIENCYRWYDKQDTLIITRSNKRANLYNQGIRNAVMDFQEELCGGDMLMVVKNNYYYAEVEKSSELDFIANGDTVTVTRVYRQKEAYGFRFAYVGLRFVDYNELEMECWVLLDTLTSPSPSLTRSQSERLFRAIEEDYMDIANKQQRYRKIMENEFFNALQVKFAYAVTCHKAQGGQWSAVFIDTLLFGEEQMTLEFLRWLYTALTRATERVYFVNWDPRFFLNPPEQEY